MIAQVGGKILSVAASLIVVKIVTSFGREFYGDYVTAYEFLAFFGIIADAGLFTIAVREMSRQRSGDSRQMTDSHKQFGEPPSQKPQKTTQNVVETGDSHVLKKNFNSCSLDKGSCLSETKTEGLNMEKNPPSTPPLKKEGRCSNQTHTEFVLSNVFSMRLVLIVGVTLIAGLIAQLVPTYSELVKQGIWITGLSMALTIVAGTLSSVLQARMKIQYFSASLAAGKVLLAAFIFFISRNLEIFPNTFFALLWAGVLSNFIFCVSVAFWASREVRIRLGFDFNWWKKTLKVSLPYGLALILQTLYLRIDVVIISFLLGSASVGVYGAATRILESFLILGVFFGQSMLPKLSSEEGCEKGRFERSLVWGMEILLLLSIPIIVATTRFSTEIINIVAGSDEFLSTATFLGSDGVLGLLIFTVFFAYLNQLFSFALVAKNKQNYLLYVNGGALALNAVLNIIFLREWGIIAAAISTIICEMFVFGLLLKNIRKHFSLPLSWKNLGVIGLANLVLFAEIYLTPLQENFKLAAVVGALTYGCILFVFRRQIFYNR